MSMSLDDPTLEDVLTWMANFAREGREDLTVITLVKKICSKLASGDYAGECLAVYYWVCQHVRYMRDPYNVEMVQKPFRTLDVRSGDCDDMATLLAAMFMACGNRCRLVAVGFVAGGPPTHVFCEVITARGAIVFDPVANRDTAKMLRSVKTRVEVEL